RDRGTGGHRASRHHDRRPRRTARPDRRGAPHPSLHAIGPGEKLPRASTPIDPRTLEGLNHRPLKPAQARGIQDTSLSGSNVGIQYMRCSGSNVLITGNDAATAIMLPDGALVSVGPYIVTQGNVLPLIVQSTMRLAADVGYNDGDIFICNDPYLGAIHAPDFA